MTENSKDLSDIDYLDKQREAVSKDRSATMAHKKFTPSYTYILPDGLNITDADNGGVDDTEVMADTFSVNDTMTNTGAILGQVETSHSYKVPNVYGFVPDSNQLLWVQYPSFGGMVLDATRTQPTFAYFGALTLVPGIVSDYGRSLDGSADYSQANSSSTLDITTGSFTICAWIYITTIQIGVIAQKRAIAVATNPGFEFLVSASGKLTATFSDGVGSVVTATGTTTLVVNTWYFVSATWNRAGNLAVYINTVQEGTSPSLTTLTNSATTSQRFTVGRRSDSSSRFLAGTISDLVMFNRALNTTELATVMSRGQLGQPDIVGFSDV